MNFINIKLIKVKVDKKVDNANKIKKVIILLISSILITTFLSGCLNPIKEVPVLKIDITYSEKQGIVGADKFSFVQDNVSYINRPKKTQAESFPAVIGRITIIKSITKDNQKVNETMIGPWETLSYKGNGSYTFYLGFPEGIYPAPGDALHISVIVVDKTGQRIGYVIQDTKWK